MKLTGEAKEVLLELVRHYESLHDGDLTVNGLQPKICPAGYWTEGYGRLVLDEKGNKIKGKSMKEKAYKFSVIKTIKQANEALEEDLTIREEMIDSLHLSSINDFQKAALISFAYNIGFDRLKKSTLLRLIKQNANFNAIDAAFRMFNKGGGVVLPGLVARRTSESYLYIFGKLKIMN